MPQTETEGLVFKLSTDKTYYAVTDYTGTSTQVFIPKKHNDLPVQSIGRDAFYGCVNITKATIPTIAISSIPKNSLSTVIIISGDSIVNNAFSGCKSLQSVTIGNSVQFIGYAAFRNCTSLQSVTIGNSVQTIGDYAFYGCDNLESITFENTSTWYRTGNSTNWQNKTGGTKTSVATPTTNATYFLDTYEYYYWYKL